MIIEDDGMESIMLIGGYVDVEVTAEEIDRARRIGTMLNNFNRKHGIAEQRGRNRDRSEEEGRHYTNEVGLIAAAKFFDVPVPERTIGKFETALIHGCRIYTTDRLWDDGILCGAKEPKDRVIIKCHWPEAAADYVRLQLWCRGRDVVKPENIWAGAKWRDGGACYRFKRGFRIDALPDALGIPVPERAR